MGFVFIRFAGAGAGVAERFSSHIEELSHYKFEQMVPVYSAVEEIVNANWEERLGQLS